MPRSQRIEKLRQRIRDLDLDAFLITSLTNIRYLYGFTGSNAVGLLTSDLLLMITDRRYTQQAHAEVSEAEIIIARHELFAEIKEKQLLAGKKKLGIEALHLPVKYYASLRKAFPEAKLVASERVVEAIASVKDESEIASMRKAGAVCTEIFAEILGVIKPGMCELDLSAEISYRSRLKGSERDPFEPIVASGPRSALPHGISSTRLLREGDLVVLDFGAVVDGYAADFTRTVALGRPSTEQQEMADVVLEALELAEASTRPGLKGKELDAIARNFLIERNYGEYFQHSLGHGLGLEVHGLPRIGERSDDTMAVGNVITLEPGVYIPDLGGVRIEDDFVVRETDVENLTPCPRRLAIVG